MQHTRRGATGGLLAGLATALAPHRAFAEPAPPSPAAPAAAPDAREPAAAAPASGADSSVATGNDPFAHLTAPVTINGQGPFTFVVDTGASISCVSRTLAETLALTIQERRKVHTLVGVKFAPMAMIDELLVGVRRARRIYALAIPIEEPGIDGVLAVDWLRHQRVTLDFADSNLQFAASRAERSAPGRVVVPARGKQGQLTIVDAELGDRRVNAVVDSGSQESLCNSALLALLDRAQAIPPRRELVHMVSVVGEPFTGERVYLPFLRLGGLLLGNVGVVHSDAHAFAIWGLQDKPSILLGMDLLRQFRAVSLDFGRSQVRFDLLPS